MGCDIHLVLEQRDADLGWVGIDTFAGHESSYGRGYNSPAARSRNYKLFAALAGVRGDGPTPRGIPEDASTTTRLLVKELGSDGHSHSWLPLIDAAREWNVERYTAEKLRDGYQEKFPESFWFGIDSEMDLSKYRVVFWFDN